MLWNIFSIKTADGLKLYGGLIQGKKRTKSVVVHVHGMGDFFCGGLLVEAVAKAANDAGHDMFAFNNRGAGLITRIGKGFFGTSLEKFEDCKKDISAALSELKRRGYNKFILSGHSTGCQKIVYYAANVKKFPIDSLILLSPADDLAIQKNLLGKKFQKCLNDSEKLCKKNKGDMILPREFKTTMWSAQRFYHLFKPKSIEGNIFNYAKPITMTGKIHQPIMAVFGEQEQYAVLPPQEMLQKISKTFIHKKSKTILIPNADHSYHGEEKILYRELKKFFTSR